MGQSGRLTGIAVFFDDFVDVAYKQLVIYGRSFIFSQTADTTTELTLSIERSNVKDLYLTVEP